MTAKDFSFQPVQPPDQQTSRETIKFDNVVNQNSSRPMLIDRFIVSDIQAESLLAPMDQVYSPSQHLHGIRTVYRYIANSTRSFMNNLRTHLPTENEIELALKNENYKIGDLKKILAYLIKKSPPNPAFCLEYFAALFENDKLVLKPVYIGGLDTIEKICEKSDDASAKNIAQRATMLQPWTDRTTQGEFLTEKINEDRFHQTYFLGYFQFDSQEISENGRAIYERRILPLLKGRSEIIFLEIPAGLQINEAGDEPILLVNDFRDLKFRYEFLCGKLIAGAKKILLEGKSTEDTYNIRKSFEALKKAKNPSTMKQLAGSVLATIQKPGTLRQIALEVFMLKDIADSIVRQAIEARQAQNKLSLDLLMKRINTRKWLTLIPASFYPQEVFNEALSKPEILGIKKSAESLGLSEDYYCLVPASLVSNIIKVANIFEMKIIEEILVSNQLASRDYYDRILYKRKKSIVFLFMNPILYIIRSLFTRKRNFIEKAFQNEIQNNRPSYVNGLKNALQTSGIRTDAAAAEKTTRSVPSAKQNLISQIIGIMFADPSPSAKWLNENDYRERLVKAARSLRENPDFPQYREKSDEAIIADIEPFLREELIEDIYNGDLPSGLDHRGKKFTRKIYSPKSIIDQPIVYESIREELEHESNQYGSKDMVEYYRSRAKLYSESSMEKFRSAERLKKAADQKSSQSTQASSVAQKTPGRQSATDKSIPQKTQSAEAPKKTGGLFKKKTKKESVTPQVLTGQQKIERTAETLSSEMREKYITKKKYSGSNLFPVVPQQMEELLDIEPGTLSIFSSENSRTFTNQFVVIKAGKFYYYFPKAFFESSKDKILKYYQDLIQHEEKLPLPNGEIIHKATDIISAIKSKK